MGTKVAPIYAALFLGKLEEDHILDNYKDYLMTFLRFLDDIFLIWLGNIEELHQFFEYINSLHAFNPKCQDIASPK